MFVPKKRYSQDPAEPGPMFVPEKRYSQDPAEHGGKNLTLYLKRIPPTPIKPESRLNATAVYGSNKLVSTHPRFRMSTTMCLCRT